VIYDLKPDLHHKESLVAGGYMTEVPKEANYSSVESYTDLWTKWHAVMCS